MKGSTENFPALIKDINPEFQEAQCTPSRINTKKATPRHIGVKLLKPKNHEAILISLCALCWGHTWVTI